MCPHEWIHESIALCKSALKLSSAYFTSNAVRALIRTVEWVLNGWVLDLVENYVITSWCCVWVRHILLEIIGDRWQWQLHYKAISVKCNCMRMLVCVCVRVCERVSLSDWLCEWVHIAAGHTVRCLLAGKLIFNKTQAYYDKLPVTGVTWRLTYAHRHTSRLYTRTHRLHTLTLSALDSLCALVSAGCSAEAQLGPSCVCNSI